MRKPSNQELAAHERLKAELRIRGTSLARIARELGVTDSALSLVGKGYHRSSRIEKALADAVGVTAEELFPHRYFREMELRTKAQQAVTIADNLTLSSRYEDVGGQIITMMSLAEAQAMSLELQQISQTLNDIQDVLDKRPNGDVQFGTVAEQSAPPMKKSKRALHGSPHNSAETAGATRPGQSEELPLVPPDRPEAGLEPGAHPKVGGRLIAYFSKYFY